MCFIFTEKFEEVDAEQLQRILHETLLQGYAKKTQGFSLESCRSMVALMDVSFMSLVTVSHDAFCRETS
ncbi:unnamed protein product [Oncorhynchus mykiss]|uniref:Uncharacterized protein n=1 Tax=Oncorhynchus mykiss TaxID=8022 RepID=A0A060XVL1_ONCMY|nr:unnamed protein product [Oncorhynchus mykiss]